MSQPKTSGRSAAIHEQDVPKTKSEQEQKKAAAQLSHMKIRGQVSMAVRVYSPFHMYYEGPAFSVSAENATGPFDILPQHHNFISLLTPCDLTVRTVDNTEQKIRISGGIMHVKADEVVVFLDV